MILVKYHGKHAHILYALKLDSFVTSEEKHVTTFDQISYARFAFQMEALWFMLNESRTLTVTLGIIIGHSVSYNPEHPELWVQEQLEPFTEGDYSSHAILTWDGKTLKEEPYYISQEHQLEETLKLLKHSLMNYPNAPVGYDAWYANRRQVFL